MKVHLLILLAKIIKSQNKIDSHSKFLRKKNVKRCVSNFLLQIQYFFFFLLVPVAEKSFVNPLKGESASVC